MPGLNADGFEAQRLADVQAELEAEFRSRFGNPQLSPETYNGQIIGIYAEREADLWELAEDTYHGAYLGSAEGAALDDKCAEVGIARLQATHSLVTAELGGTPGTPVPSGSLFQDPVTETQWETLALAVIGGGGTVLVAAQSVDTGPIEALSGSLTDPITVISGWNTVTNPLDAEVGRDVEKDSELRFRYVQAMFVSRGSSLEAMVSALTRVDSVTQVHIRENDSDMTDTEGRPAHSFEAVIVGGTDQDVADTIWQTKPLGIRAYGTGGTASVATTDSQGNARTVGFTRPTSINIYVDIQYSANSQFPTDGEALIEQAILDEGALFVADRDVIAFELVQRIEVQGIVGLVLTVGRSASPTGTLEPISVREIADFDSTRVTITRV